MLEGSGRILGTKHAAGRTEAARVATTIAGSGCGCCAWTHPVGLDAGAELMIVASHIDVRLGGAMRTQ